MSTSRQPKDGRVGSARKLSADSNPLGSKPAPRSSRPSARLALASSSIIATLLVPMGVAGHASSGEECRLLPLGAGLLWLVEPAGLAREGSELGDRAHSQLGGDRAAMQLNSALMYTERGGDLFVHLAVHYMGEHLALAHGECGKPPFELLAVGVRCARARTALQSLREGAQQCAPRCALVEKIDRSLAHGGHRTRRVS